MNKLNKLKMKIEKFEYKIGFTIPALIFMTFFWLCILLVCLGIIGGIVTL